MSAGVDASVARPAAWELPGPAEQTAAPGASALDYVLLRLTGLVLSVLVLGHFAVTHVVTDVADDNAAFVARRLSSWLWIAWDSTMLAAALAHAGVGVRVAFADYSSGRVRRAVGRGVTVLVVVLFALGAIAIARAAHA